MTETTLRACLLSGGDSRRMGRDKALLPHPEGGCWLERTLRVLLELPIPVTLLSRHPAHLQLAESLAWRHPFRSDLAPLADSTTGQPPGAEMAQVVSGPGPAQSAAARSRLSAVAEPEPWQGPLLALHRLMQLHPDQRLLLCPVDMPLITAEVLGSLVQAAAAEPQLIHLAHDGERRQPLLGIYPSQAAQRDGLRQAIETGERRLQGWLASQVCREVRLDPASLRNINGPDELAAEPLAG